MILRALVEEIVPTGMYVEHSNELRGSDRKISLAKELMSQGLEYPSISRCNHPNPHPGGNISISRPRPITTASRIKVKGSPSLSTGHHLYTRP